MPTTKVDQLYDEITTRKPGVGDLGVIIAQLNMYEALGNHIDEIRRIIDESGEVLALRESLDRNVPLYTSITGIEPLPNDDRRELIERLSTTFRERHDAWTQTPEYTEEQRRMHAILD